MPRKSRSAFEAFIPSLNFCDNSVFPFVILFSKTPGNFRQRLRRRVFVIAPLSFHFRPDLTMRPFRANSLIKAPARDVKDSSEPEPAEEEES